MSLLRPNQQFTKSARVYQIVASIPVGKVLTYKTLAGMAGVSNPRLVGTILHHNPNPSNIPCHRVLNSQGKVAKRYAFGGAEAQAGKLRQEGIMVTNNKVVLKQYLWRPE